MYTTIKVVYDVQWHAIEGVINVLCWETNEETRRTYSQPHNVVKMNLVSDFISLKKIE